MLTKKNWVARICAAGAVTMTLMPALGHADSVAAGLVTRYTVGADNVGLYISANAGSACPSNWYYAVRSDFASVDEFKLIAASALAVYSMGKNVALYYSASGCSLKRFSVIDTID